MFKKTILELVNLIRNLRYIPFLFLSLLLSFTIHSQSLQLFDINYDEYPTIKTLFKATNTQGNTLFNIKKEEVQIFENNIESEILYFKSPSKTIEPLSIILVFDISGSMDGERIKIAKQAANTFLDLTSGKGFEIAITTFHSTSFINSDFTNNSKRLKSIVEKLEGFGGTNYDSAFFQPQTGIFEIAKNAHHKKVVIFMTDGQSHANADSITTVANKNNISVYCTTIKLPMPEILKDISTETGGYFYEQINSPDKAKNIYTDLYYEIVSSELGIIKWKAAQICDIERQVAMHLRDLKTTSNYSLLNYINDNYEIKPRSFFIDAGTQGKTISRTFLVKAHERPITIKNITTNTPENIKIDNQEYPVIIQPGESTSIRMFCTHNDSVQAKAKVYIEMEDCIENTELDVFFGKMGGIEITYPEGGEFFAIGTPINITWKGVPKNQDVSLFFKNGDSNWQPIGNGKDLQYTWTTSRDTGSHYQIKVECLDAFEKAETQQLTDKNGFWRLYDLSSDGSLVTYKTRDGFVKVVHIQTGEVLKNYQAGDHRYLFFSDDNKKLITYYKNSFGIIDIYSDADEKYVTSGEQGFLFAVNTSNIGDEYLMSAKIRLGTFAGYQRKIENYVTGESFFIPEQKSQVNYVAISNDNSKIFFLNGENELLFSKKGSKRIKKITEFAPGYKKIFVSPFGEYIYAIYPKSMRVVKTQNGKTLLNSDADFYIRFSPNGKNLLTFDTTRHINLWDLENKQKIYNFQYSNNVNFSPSGKLLHYYRDNTVHIFDIQKGKFILKKYIPEVSIIRISPDDQEFLVTMLAMCRVYNISSGELTNEIKTQSYGGVRDAFFDVNSNVLIQSAAMLSLWEPKQTYHPGVSNRFTIVSPKPTVLKEFDMGKVTVGTSRETIIKDFIKNETDFTIHIQGSELENDTTPFHIVSGNHEQDLASENSIDLELGFSPIEPGEASSYIYVFTQDTLFKCHIKGEGIKQQISIPGKTINFGKHFVGTQKDTVFLAVKNISSTSLQIEDIKNINPDKNQFKIHNLPEPTLLQTGETFFLKGSYHPLYEGRSSGAIQITIMQVPQPVYINLLGEGLAPKGIVVKGKTLNSLDSLPVEAKVSITDLSTQEEVLNLNSNKNGKYEGVLNSPHQLLVHAEKEGFISGSEMISPSAYLKTDTIYRDIYLTPLSGGNLFRLNGIFFEYAKAKILPASENDLNRVIKLLQANPEISLEIHGHTDNKGTEKGNLSLSKARAESVKNYLQENGINPAHLEIIYFGESQPVATNETDEGRQLNRRVEFRIK